MADQKIAALYRKLWPKKPMESTILYDMRKARFISEIKTLFSEEYPALISENESLKADLLKSLEAQKLMKEASESCYGACREFVCKVECGGAHSVKSYAQMKEAIAQYEKALKGRDMKAIYKKHVIVGHGIRTGPVVRLIDIPLNIHYEAQTFNGATVRCEPYEIGAIDHDVVYLNGYPADLSTLRLVIEEELDATPDAMPEP